MRAWLGLLAVPLLALGCGGASTVAELQQERYFYALDRVGEVVELNGVVTELRGPRMAEVADVNSGATTLPVVTAQPIAAHEGDEVHVRGTVGQWHFSEPADRAPYVQHDLYAERTTRTYLYDAALSPR